MRRFAGGLTLMCDLVDEVRDLVANTVISESVDKVQVSATKDIDTMTARGRLTVRDLMSESERVLSKA